MDAGQFAKIRDLVATKYKSLERPDFSSVKQGFQTRPYDPLIRKLRDYAAVEETIESDDDVCFSFLLQGRAALWKLELSLIGPFGLFVRAKNKVSADDFLNYTRPDLTSFEIRIADILKSAGIKLLTVKELGEPLPMTLFNTSKADARLYQALFSDRARLPWEP